MTNIQERNLFYELMIPSREEWGEGIVKEFRHVHTAILTVDNQQGSTIQHRELCSMLCGSLDGKGVWGTMGPCICMAESLCCPPETIKSLVIGYTQI